MRLSWDEELFNQVTEEALFVTSGYQVQAGRLSNVMDEQMTAAQEMTHRIIRLFMLCCTVVVFPTHSLCYVSYTHLRAHETLLDVVRRLLVEIK